MARSIQLGLTLLGTLCAVVMSAEDPTESLPGVQDLSKRQAEPLHRSSAAMLVLLTETCLQRLRLSTNS